MKSVITEAKVTVRINTGDFNYEEGTLAANVQSGEDGVKVLRELKLQINEGLGAKGTVEEENEELTKKKAGKNGKPSKQSKSNTINDEDESEEDTSEDDSGADDESDEDNETSDSEDSDDVDSDADESDEDEVEEEKPAKKGSSSSKGGKKTRQKGPEEYNRDLEQHKEVFGGIVRSINPDYRKSDKLKALVKTISTELEGEPFLDENGEVLSSFSKEVAKRMKGKK
jgi:cobalamin biosynthesis protein CobT